jgi:hypothetical protein
MAERMRFNLLYQIVPHFVRKFDSIRVPLYFLSVALLPLQREICPADLYITPLTVTIIVSLTEHTCLLYEGNQ